jgi:hypothetical protein
MKINFKELVVKNIDDTVFEKGGKTVANIIYQLSNKDLSLLDIARDIFKDKEVELTQVQTDEVKRLLQDEKVIIPAFQLKAILDYIDNYK